MPKRTIIDRFNTYFSGDLLVQLGEKAAMRAMRIWKRTGLPEPSDDEYFYGDHGITVALNRSGLALVFRARSQNFLRHSSYEAGMVRDDHVLQPLYRRALDENACFEVRPGIKRAGVTAKDVKQISVSLKEAGLALHAGQAGFIGLLPTGARDLVVANTHMLRVKGKMQGGGQTQLQDKIYGALSAQVAEAFISASPTRIADMFNNCRDITARKEGDPRKILYASWGGDAQLGPDTKDLVDAARAYGARLPEFR